MTEKKKWEERERLMKCVSKVRAVCVCVCGLGSPGAAWKGLRKALWFLRHTHTEEWRWRAVALLIMELHQSRLSSAGLELRPDLTFNLGGRATSTSVVQQQDYLSSVWLSKKDKLEHVSLSPRVCRP